MINTPTLSCVRDGLITLPKTGRTAIDTYLSGNEGFKKFIWEFYNVILQKLEDNSMNLFNKDIQKESFEELLPPLVNLLSTGKPSLRFWINNDTVVFNNEEAEIDLNVDNGPTVFPAGSDIKMVFMVSDIAITKEKFHWEMSIYHVKTKTKVTRCIIMDDSEEYSDNDEPPVSTSVPVPITNENEAESDSDSDPFPDTGSVNYSDSIYDLTY